MGLGEKFSNIDPINERSMQDISAYCVSVEYMHGDGIIQIGSFFFRKKNKVDILVGEMYFIQMQNNHT